MGGGSWKGADWDAYSTSRSYDSKTPDEVINRTGVKSDFLPTNFKNGRRESRDSVDNPKSTAIILGGDVTGSMGHLAGLLIKEGMAKFATGLYDRKPVSDPHIMCAAIGDMNCDSWPLQATQFEADIRIIEQLEGLYVEGGGGGNNFESYNGPWLMAALMTDIDCFEKRGEKGLLFTYGDEEAPGPITRDQAKRFLGLDIEHDLSAEDILAMVSRSYDVYHLMIMQGSHAKVFEDRVRGSWTELLGQRAIPVTDYTKLSEILLGILDVTRKGVDKDTVSKSFHGGTSVVVASAIKNLTVAEPNKGSGLVAL